MLQEHRIYGQSNFAERVTEREGGNDGWRWAGLFWMGRGEDGEWVCITAPKAEPPAEWRDLWGAWVGRHAAAPVPPLPLDITGYPAFVGRGAVGALLGA